MKCERRREETREVSGLLERRAFGEDGLGSERSCGMGAGKGFRGCKRRGVLWRPGGWREREVSHSSKRARMGVGSLDPYGSPIEAAVPQDRPASGPCSGAPLLHAASSLPTAVPPPTKGRLPASPRPLMPSHACLTAHNHIILQPAPSTPIPPVCAAASTGAHDETAAAATSSKNRSCGLVQRRLTSAESGVVNG